MLKYTSASAHLPTHTTRAIEFRAHGKNPNTSNAIPQAKKTIKWRALYRSFLAIERATIVITTPDITRKY